MKDSQDWLDTLLGNLVCEAEIAGSHLGDLSNERVASYKGKIRERFLKEAIELLGEDSTSASKPLGIPESRWLLYQGRDSLRQELRNKFNDKYKED